MAFAVLTRDLDEGSGYPPALAALGLEAVAMPVTRTEPPPDPDALGRALAHGGHAMIVVASARAARALAGAANLPPVFAVGPATERALAAAGIAATTFDGAHDAASLAWAIIAARPVAGARVLVPRAQDGRDEAIALLRAAGAEVDDVVAYRTVPVALDDPGIARGRELLITGEARVCAVFAPSQVSALAAVCDLPGLVAGFVAIGETTAAALRAAGVRTVCVAASPTPRGLAEAASAVYTARP